MEVNFKHTNARLNAAKNVAAKFAIVAARFAVGLLDCSQILNEVLPIGVKIATNGVVYALSAAHARRNYNVLNLALVCRVSYWVWFASLFSDIINAIYVPSRRFLTTTIRALESTL